MENNSSIVIYTTKDGQTQLDVTFDKETVWLTIAQMSELFQRDRSVISKHIKGILADGELDEKSNVQILHIANSDKPVKFYNLDMILAVGYRVRSQRGIQFRVWASQLIKEYQKYQAKTLSEVERDYLETVKVLAEKVER